MEMRSEDAGSVVGESGLNRLETDGREARSACAVRVGSQFHLSVLRLSYSEVLGNQPLSASRAIGRPF